MGECKEEQVDLSRTIGGVRETALDHARRVSRKARERERDWEQRRAGRSRGQATHGSAPRRPS